MKINLQAATENTESHSANADDQQVDQAVTDSKTESVNERLLNESKKYKERAQAAERALESERKAKLEEQGKYKELFEKSEKEKQELKASVLREKVDSKVLEAARKAGSSKPDLVLKLGEKDLLKYDETTFEVYGVDEYVESVKKMVPELFAPTVNASINPASPSQTKEKVITAKDVAKMSSADRVKYMTQLVK